MQTTMLMNEKQFAAWKAMFDADAEYADEVLRYFGDLVAPLPTPEEAITDLCREDEGEYKLGFLTHPVFGMSNQAAKKLTEMV